MAAVELYTSHRRLPESPRPLLRVVPDMIDGAPHRRGPLVANRRAARARMKVRRRRCVVAVSVVGSLTLLAWPGHALGGTNGVGLSTDLASSSTLSSGAVYIAQPGDTVARIAALANPVDPSSAYHALITELRSSVIVAGEHVVIP